MEEKYTEGVYVALPIVGVVTLACVIFLVLGIVRKIHERQDEIENYNRYGYMLIIVSLVILAVTWGIFSFAWWPFDMDYHKYKPVTGTVQKVDKRLLNQTEVFMITYENNKQKYRCDDTRCVDIKPGDKLTMYCIPEFQVAATDGLACNFVKVE